MIVAAGKGTLILGANVDNGFWLEVARAIRSLAHITWNQNPLDA